MIITQTPFRMSFFGGGISSSLVPFVNKFPRNTELYKLMTSNVKC